MKKYFLLALLMFSSAAFANHHKMTMQYGGDWVDAVAVGHGDFMRMSGVFRGSNEMTLESGEVIITNFTCPGWWDAATGGNGACNMKDSASSDYWVLSWDCDAAGNCTGEAKGGTGRFEGVTGSMNWKDVAGFGKGGGTFMMKH